MIRLIKNLHFIILFYLAYGEFEIYQELLERKEQAFNQVPVAERKVKKLEKEKARVKSYKEDIENAKKKIELVAQKIENLQKKLPSTANYTRNLDFIKGTAKDLNIKEVYLNPGIETKNGFYLTKKYSFKAVGTYLQFLIFLEQLSSSEQLLNVGEVELVKANKGQKGRFQTLKVSAVLESYRYNESFKEDRGIKAIEARFKKKESKKRRKRKSKRGQK